MYTVWVNWCWPILYVLLMQECHRARSIQHAEVSVFISKFLMRFLKPICRISCLMNRHEAFLLCHWNEWPKTWSIRSQWTRIIPPNLFLSSLLQICSLEASSKGQLVYAIEFDQITPSSKTSAGSPSMKYKSLPFVSAYHFKCILNILQLK